MFTVYHSVEILLSLDGIYSICNFKKNNVFLLDLFTVSFYLAQQQTNSFLIPVFSHHLLQPQFSQPCTLP